MSSTEKPLLPIYLFNGDDVLKQETLLERLRQRIAAVGDLSMNAQTLNAKDIAGPAHLLDVLNTIPFGSPVRLVVIKDADALPKKLQEALADYVRDPSEMTVVALIARKLPANSRLYKAIIERDRQSLIDCGSKKRSELPALIRGMARGEGVDITTSAANLLIDRIGTSTVPLNNEVRKLAAIAQGSGSRVIEDEDVVNNVARVAAPKPWELTNALALRDVTLCLTLADQMRGYTAVGLFTQCVSKIREILTAATLRKRGLPIAASMGKQEWQLREVMRAIERYHPDELEMLLRRAPGIEMRMKSGADADQLLRLWIIDACTRKGTRTQQGRQA